MGFNFHPPTELGPADHENIGKCYIKQWLGFDQTINTQLKLSLPVAFAVSLRVLCDTMKVGRLMHLKLYQKWSL
jgi:hypothetical protein